MDSFKVFSKIHKRCSLISGLFIFCFFCIYASPLLQGDGVGAGLLFSTNSQTEEENPTENKLKEAISHFESIIKYNSIQILSISISLVDCYRLPSYWVSLDIPTPPPPEVRG